MKLKFLFPHSIKKEINKAKMNQITQGGLNISNNSNIYRINKEKKVVFYLFEYFIFLFLIQPILLSYENNITLTIMKSTNNEIILNYQNIEGNPIIIDPQNYEYDDSVPNQLKYHCESDICNITLSFSDNMTANASEMFKGCNTIISIDFTNFNTSNITSMSNMFENCTSLTSIVNLSTKEVHNYSYMFYNCFKLKNIENFQMQRDVSIDIYMEYMFANCIELESINISIEGYRYAHTIQ